MVGFAAFCGLHSRLARVGSLATTACAGPGTCAAANQFCYSDANGIQGCCLLPRCPSGEFARGICTRAFCFTLSNDCAKQMFAHLAAGTNTCPLGTLCLNNICCTPPRCQDGSIAQQVPVLTTKHAKVLAAMRHRQRVLAVPAMREWTCLLSAASGHVPKSAAGGVTMHTGRAK